MAIGDPIVGNNKAWAAGFASFGSIIIVFVWNSFMPSHPMTIEVSGALEGFLTILSVYLTPHGAQQ